MGAQTITEPLARYTCDWPKCTQQEETNGSYPKGWGSENRSIMAPRGPIQMRPLVYCAMHTHSAALDYLVRCGLTADEAMEQVRGYFEP